MDSKEFIKRVINKSENPVDVLERMASVVPSFFEGKETRDFLNESLRTYGYKVNDDFVTAYSLAHPSCGSGNGYGSGFGHPSCGGGYGNGGGSGHPACAGTVNKGFSYKLLMPIKRNEMGNTNGIRN